MWKIFRIAYGVLLIAIVVVIIMLLSVQPMQWNLEKITVLGVLLSLGVISGLGMIYFELES